MKIGSRKGVIAAASIALVVLVGLALWLFIALWAPAPPRTVLMSTGAPGQAYQAYGERYRGILRKSGVELRLLPSAGALENLDRLRDASSGVSVGFVQDGTTNAAQAPDLVALGTICYEPLWFFYRSAPADRKLEWLRGKRISIGAEGSGTRALALRLLALNGIDQNIAKLLPLSPQAAADGMVRGEVEAAIIVSSWESPAVRQLLVAPNIEIGSFARADAYVALLPFLSKLVLPQGVADLAQNRPPTDTVLLAPKTSLVVRKDLHPAIQYLLLDAAAQAHSGPGIFQKAGQFPAFEAIDVPLSEYAQQYSKSGRPFLQRYLPFWLAVIAQQLLVLMIPILGVVYPMLRFVPTLYGWSMRRRVFALYGELKLPEAELELGGKGSGSEDLRARFERLEYRANHMRVPTAFAHLLYALRLHMTLVRGRLERSEEVKK